MKKLKEDINPLGFKFPRRVKVIAKRINQNVNDLVSLLHQRGVKNCVSTTYLNDEQLLIIEDLIKVRTSKHNKIKKFPKKNDIHIEIEKKEKEYNDKDKIQNLINEYEFKIKDKKNALHLISFYENELQKLKKVKQFSGSMSTEIIELNWENIIFENYAIRAKINNRITNSYPFSNSRESFNHLKQYFIKIELKPIKIFLANNTIIGVKNGEEIYKAIEFFSFKDMSSVLSTLNYDIIETQIKKLNNSFSRKIISFKKSIYLNYLADLHNEEFKIIPVFENNFDGSDSFIFTLFKNNTPYLLWESCSSKKATYIFKSASSDYVSNLIKLIKMIQSDEIHRMDIRNYIKTNDNNILEGKCIIHYDFAIWKEQICLFQQ